MTFAEFFVTSTVFVGTTVFVLMKGTPWPERLLVGFVVGALWPPMLLIWLISQVKK